MIKKNKVARILGHHPDAVIPTAKLRFLHTPPPPPPEFEPDGTPKKCAEKISRKEKHSKKDGISNLKVAVISGFN